jgi:hypothetical protein
LPTLNRFEGRFHDRPTEDEVLVKAKQLARDDGRLWDTEDIADAPAARDRSADDIPSAPNI